MNTKLVYLLIPLFLFSCSPNSDKVRNSNKNDHRIENPNLKNDLEKFNGYYSQIESQDGKLNPKELPADIVNFRKAKINDVSIVLLQKITRGYNLQFNIDFSGYNALVVSTLNDNYSFVDYKIYPNGTGANDPEKDTVTVITYDKNTVIVQLMHPSLYEEAEFEVNGIREEFLTIGNDLILKSQMGINNGNH